MHRVTVQRENSKLDRLLIGFFAGFCCCVILALCIVIVPLQNTTEEGSYTVDTYTASKCIVEHPTGDYKYDENWHIPSGGPREDKSNCLEPSEILNTTDGRITMDEVVYTFIVPHVKRNDTGIWTRGFSRWILTLEAFLFLDVVFDRNHTEELTIAKLTYEVRMGYQNNIMNDKRYWRDNATLPQPEDEWTIMAETTESRTLKCYLQPHGIVKGVKYGCNLFPFFRLPGVLHNHFLINIRFPNDVVGNSVFNSDLQYIKDIQLILRHQTAVHTRNFNLIKMIYFPLTMEVFFWYFKRLHFRPKLPIDRTCLYLGFCLLILDTPLEFLTIYADVYFSPLYNYDHQELFFIASLILFCTAFFLQFIRPRMQLKNACLTLFYLSPFNLFLMVFLIDLYEKLVQSKNPFFSVWDSISGFRHSPEFNLFLVIFSAIYVLIVSFQFNSFYNDTVIKQKIVLRTRGYHLYKGGIKALRFLMFGVYSVTILTVMQFMYFQVESAAFKILGPIEKVQSMNSSPYLTVFLFLVFGMRNLFAYSFLILYAPAAVHNHNVNNIEEHEMNVIGPAQV
ncbi:hypothetical protein JTE90_023027 [Oedothorax gibbosus]|uniref:Protein wntless n=1 Tax=Oedothorax gibbosus TaxID=931172 RepID=A0AAV6V2P7_9ARAC|nr:hypothetical protein JTE90_023027 [Oedothorax gibbosus]